MRRTKELIKTAFIQLLEERPLNKITVKDIVDRCDINRNTFYYNYQDIPGLLHEIMEEKINILIKEHCVFGRPLDCIKPALQYGSAHKQAVLHIYRAISREIFIVYLNRFVGHMVNEYFDSILKNITISAEDDKIFRRYYKCIIVGCLLDWLDAGMIYDLEAEIERICFLMDGNSEHAIQKAAYL